MRKRAVLILLIAGLTGCRGSTTPTRVPKEIFVPVGARNIRSTAQKSGQVEVTYVIREAHPADRTHEGFAQALIGHGYHLLDHDFLDPSRTLSIPRGWALYVDGRRRPQTCVRELIEDWQTASGQIVRYGLAYRCVCEASTDIAPESVTDELAVQALLLPADLVRRTAAAVQKARGERQ